MKRKFTLLLLFGLVDALLLCSLFIPAVIFDSLQPFHRGFFCDDESISYPFLDNTVPTWLLILLCLLLPFVVIVVSELSYFIHLRKKQWPEASIWPRNLPCFRLHAVIDNVIIAVIYFLAGWCLVLSFTGMGKFSIGRLRPHFLDVCQPNWSNLTCFYAGSSTRFQYVETYQCTSTDTAKLKEARLSFPSGHASSSVYSAIFIALYVQYRIHWTKVRFLKVFVQSFMMLLAILCGLSRISDYKHHWSDVLVGSLLGAVLGVFIIMGVWKLDEKFAQVEKIRKEKKMLSSGLTATTGMDSP